MTYEDTAKKARLLELGEIFIPKEIDMPCFASLSRAGPDTGSGAHAFEFGESRVKLTVSKDPEARLRLARDTVGFIILLDGRKFLGDVRILPLAAHSPNQAFLNLSGECSMGCAFCSMPRPGKGEFLSPERVLKMVSVSSKYPGFQAVALTSGIPGSVGETNREMAKAVKAVRAEYPAMPIGVEAYFEDLADIMRLAEAGATEIKINIETWPKDRFGRICPNRDFSKTLKAMEKAVTVFGWGKVTSNIIVGLGETDEEVREALENLSAMGVMPNLRGIRIGPGNRDKLEKALGHVPERVSGERLLALGKVHGKILEKNSLDTREFETMCFSCRCCDIVPMADL